MKKYLQIEGDYTFDPKTGEAGSMSEMAIFSQLTAIMAQPGRLEQPSARRGKL